MAIEFLRDEIDKRKEEIRDRRRQGGSAVFDETIVRNKKSGYHYHGVANRPRRIAVFENKGYEKVSATDQEAWSVAYPNASGARELGDQILMRVPIDRYIDLRAQGELKQEQLVASVTNQARENINRLYRDEAMQSPTDTRSLGKRDITFEEMQDEGEHIATISRPKKG